jgi:hypothetical protein
MISDNQLESRFCHWVWASPSELPVNISKLSKQCGMNRSGDAVEGILRCGMNKPE